MKTMVVHILALFKTEGDSKFFNVVEPKEISLFNNFKFKLIYLSIYPTSYVFDFFTVVPKESNKLLSLNLEEINTNIFLCHIMIKKEICLSFLICQALNSYYRATFLLHLNVKLLLLPTSPI